MNKSNVNITKEIAKEIIRIIIFYFYLIILFTSYIFSIDEYSWLYDSDPSIKPGSIINHNRDVGISLFFLVLLIVMQAIIFFCEKKKEKKIFSLLLMIPPILIFIFRDNFPQV